MKNHKELIILIAEDDDGHAELIREGLINSGVCNKQIRFSNGIEAWEYLTDTAIEQIKGRKTAYLLLLDINMPRMNGVELLTKIKSNDELKEVLIIMLTTTDDPREIELCYKMGCNMYVTKPVQFDKFAETLNRMGLFLQIIKV